jgi:Anti-sigma-K factor rskA
VSGRRPDLDELVGSGLDPAEYERLRLVHELLLEAGPPPELAPSLAAPPAAWPTGRLIAFPRRRRATLLLIAAATVLAVFGAGWLGGATSKTAQIERTITMSGPAGAHATLQLLHADNAGNWPMTINISGLAALPAGQTYALWLTKNGKLDVPCGTFTVGAGTTTVNLNAPYHLTEYDGWVVVRNGSTTPMLTTGST